MGILDDILKGATKYAPLIKTGVAALSTYASFKDQQKKNELQQAAYDDYMAQADAAGHAARAAIDINYTPMTVSGVPTTKADVTDFTAVAAKGGLMSIPNKQRKRYARGPQEFEVEQMDEEIFSPGDFKMETGVDVLGEQVFYDTGKGDRPNAQMIWDQMGAPERSIHDFDFEIFFMNGDWRDQIKSQVDVQEDTRTASAPDPTDEMNNFSYNTFGKPLHELTPDQLQELYDLANEQAAAPGAEGIMQAAKGGRIGLQSGFTDPKNMTTEMLISVVKDGRSTPEILIELEKRVPGAIEQIKLEEGQGDQAFSIKQHILDQYDPDKRAVEEEFLYDLRENIDSNYREPKDFVGYLAKPEMDMAHGGRIGFGSGSKPKYKKFLKLLSDLEERSPELMAWGLMGASTIIPFLKKGGRVKRDNGGIMNLGGLEKDYRTTGGFVPIGAYEKKDDVPARLSKNEFVFTADAVRAAGGGSINKGAQRMYDTMKNLEARPTAKRMTA